MRIETIREGGSARLRLEGRLDREWAEHLSDTLDDLLQDGVRSLDIDFSRVTYVSSAVTTVLTRWQQEMAVLRGEVRLSSLPDAVREVFAVAGWQAELAPGQRAGRGSGELRRSSWHTRADLAESGQYELSASVAGATLSCRLYGEPARLRRDPIDSGHCRVVPFPEDAFGLGLGAIGSRFGDCHERLGELVGVAGCVAYFPSDGAQKADYLVGSGKEDGVPRAVLASGFVCEGGFSQLIRFSMQADGEAIPFSELATVGLEATGGRTAGLVVAGETAGLCGVRLRRSPGHDAAPIRFDVPAVRDWLLFSPERIHPMTTTVIAGVVARAPEGPLAAHLRPLGATGKLFGHFHAAVFSYHPLPQRTVDLPALLRGLFSNHRLLDVLHLIWDDRGDEAVGESALVRGVAWAAPIASVGS